ncbi:unnamed protein product [Auanema sp. JU1783]|nr:unnamed protein product [Auanema sp. JU1783]
MNTLIFLCYIVCAHAIILKLPLMQQQSAMKRKSLGRMLVNSRSAELKNIRNQRYLCTVSIGNPPQNYSLMLDTGSTHTWIVGKECTGSTCDCADNYRKHKYDAHESNSFVNVSEKITVRYLSTQITGYAAQDDMSIQGISFPKQKIIVATELPESLGAEENDGLLGFAWQYTNNMVPFIQNVLSQLHFPVFTIWLNKQENDDGIGGMMTLGDFDIENCSPNVTFHPLSSKHQWNVLIEEVQIGSYKSSVQVEGISDTGAPRIGCPEEPFNELVRQMNATVVDGIVIVSCEDIHHFPDIQFIIGGINYKITSYQYTRRFHDFCLANILKMNTPRNLWLLGDPWIRSYCHIFDMGLERIGLSETRNHHNQS